MNAHCAQKDKKARRKTKEGKLFKKADYTRWGKYIYKVLKQVHNGIGISSKAVSILESVCDDVLDQLATQGADLARGAKGHTLGSREVLSAATLVLPGQLGVHAQDEGRKAFNKFMTHVKKPEGGKKKKATA